MSVSEFRFNLAAIKAWVELKRDEETESGIISQAKTAEPVGDVMRNYRHFLLWFYVCEV